MDLTQKHTKSSSRPRVIRSRPCARLVTRGLMNVQPMPRKSGGSSMIKTRTLVSLGLFAAF
jgi:hypothetical protein